MSEEPGSQPDITRRRPASSTLLAELLGAFALTGVAATAGTMGRVTGSDVDTIAKAVAPGLLVMAFIYALGDASGAHFNPAVTLGFALRRVFPWRWIPWYWAAQLVGAVGAGAMLSALFGSVAEAGVTQPHVPALTATAIEVFLSWLLLTVILGTADRFRIVGQNAALAVGGTIALCGLIAEPLTGASMNPARSLGPAIVTGALSDAWIYVAGPFLGMALAVALTTAVHGPAAGNEPVEAATGDASG
jgi:MIP family channel proteins